MPNSRRRWPIPFLDLSNTLFFFFVALFAITLIAVSDTDSKAKVDTTSKLLITLKWSDGSANDVDLSLKTPAGHIVWFRQKEQDFASLDHDNLGTGNTSVTDAEGKTITAATRDEVIFIRQAMAGTYTVNVHYYAGSGSEPVAVTLVSVDPSYRQVISRALTLTEKHEEHTAFRFTVDQSGAVTGTDLIEELFVNDLLGAKT